MSGTAYIRLTSKLDAYRCLQMPTDALPQPMLYHHLGTPQTRWSGEGVEKIQLGAFDIQLRENHERKHLMMVELKLHVLWNMYVP